MPSLRAAPPALLELDLTQPLLEVEPDDPIGKLRSRGKPRLSKVLRTLHDAGSDPKVAGLIAKIGGKIPLAIGQEVRAAVRDFAASGKPTVAWAETFGESGNGTVAYFLATGFGEIWMQQSGELGLLGVMSEVTFLRGVFDNLGIEPQFDKRYEYKHAADRLMQTGFTEHHKETATRLAESAFEEIVRVIASARNLTEDQVRTLVDEAPLSAARGVEARLLDRCGYRDEVYADVRRRIASDARLLFATKWSKPTPLPSKVTKAITDRNQPVVALVEGHGAIVMGRNRRSPIDGPQMGSDTLSAALRAARNDDKVRAVVFRVDSPGGSYVASDTVWREVCLLREAGKPVVVSMGTVAGSGGYFISCPADVIVAQSGTLTGSIGVLAGKPNLSKLLDRVGVGTGTVQFGASARMYSPREGFTDLDRQKLNTFLDEVYADFVTKVAQGRGMAYDAVHQVAKGRVWTGADAAKNGLVDVLGGVRDAASIARERAGLPATAPLRPAVQVPLVAKVRSPKSSEDPRALSVVTSMSGWDGFASLAANLGLPAGGPLMMPSIRLG
ncbi:MAG: signal peptide peptidase SppA [Frankiaceae bacterium]|nr:signal peptide peptidase SppA [Frankiaceae bacterium]MBV9871616.1 signal peptide peptidase SppA [Frankiaceae bacterium]